MFSECSLSDEYVTPLILAILSIVFSIVMDYGIYAAIKHYIECDDIINYNDYFFNIINYPND